VQCVGLGMADSRITEEITNLTKFATLRNGRKSDRDPSLRLEQMEALLAGVRALTSITALGNPVCACNE
jgi:hypothetical protein